MNDDEPAIDRNAGWWLDAECRGLTTAERDDIFFPNRGDATAPAKAICRTCPVRDQCLDYAITNGEKFGIWGGLSERERRRLRRARHINPTLTIGGAA